MSREGVPVMGKEPSSFRLTVPVATFSLGNGARSRLPSSAASMLLYIASTTLSYSAVPSSSSSKNEEPVIVIGSLLSAFHCSGVGCMSVRTNALGTVTLYWADVVPLTVAVNAISSFDSSGPLSVLVAVKAPVVVLCAMVSAPVRRSSAPTCAASVMSLWTYA